MTLRLLQVPFCTRRLEWTRPSTRLGIPGQEMSLINGLLFASLCLEEYHAGAAGTRKKRCEKMDSALLFPPDQPYRPSFALLRPFTPHGGPSTGGVKRVSRLLSQTEHSLQESGFRRSDAQTVPVPAALAGPFPFCLPDPKIPTAGSPTRPLLKGLHQRAAWHPVLRGFRPGDRLNEMQFNCKALSSLLSL